MNLGDIIYKLRKESRMTLVDMSNKSGIALATLSRIENGKMIGTLRSHMKICEVLGISLPDLYKELPSQKKKLGVQKKQSDQLVSVHDKKITVEMLASNVHSKKMLPVLIKLHKGGATNTEETARGVEKFVYIIDGKVEAKVGEESYPLSAGDTIYFDSSVAHSFKNEGAGEARLLSTSSNLPKT